MIRQTGARAMLRRKLLRLGGIGALLGLARRAEPAEAANGDPLIIGQTNAATSPTILRRVSSALATLEIVQLTPTKDQLKPTVALNAKGATGVASGSGVVARGGTTDGFRSGHGIVVSGGLSNRGRGGDGVRAEGGSSGSGMGGFGGEMIGGYSDSNQGGNGLSAVGGESIDGVAGSGAIGEGSSSANKPAGGGIVAVGGYASKQNGQPGAGALAYGGRVTISGSPDAPGGIGLFARGGVLGKASSGIEPGVFGENTGGGPGILGESATGVGVHGLSGSGPGGSFETGGANGVYSFSTDGPGVAGHSTIKPGLSGSSQADEGISAYSFASAGVAGVAAIGIGGYFQTESKDQFALSLDNTKAAGGVAGNGAFGLYVKGNSVVENGTKPNAAVQTSQGMRLLYVVEAPVALFEDLGTIRLTGGRARVTLDPLFAETIDTTEYLVFLTPRGDSRGVYVATQDATGFEIREGQGGSSSAEVGYRVVAQRKGLTPAHRLARFTPPNLPKRPEVRPPARPARLPTFKVPPRPPRPERPPEARP